METSQSPDQHGGNWDLACREGYRNVVYDVAAEPLVVEANGYSWSSKDGFRPRRPPQEQVDQLRQLLQETLDIRDMVGRLAINAAIEGDVGLAVEAGLAGASATEPGDLFRLMLMYWVNRLIPNVLDTLVDGRERVDVALQHGGIRVEINALNREATITCGQAHARWYLPGLVAPRTSFRFAVRDAYMLWQHRDDMAKLLTAIDAIPKMLQEG